MFFWRVNTASTGLRIRLLRHCYIKREVCIDSYRASSGVRPSREGRHPRSIAEGVSPAIGFEMMGMGREMRHRNARLWYVPSIAVGLSLLAVAFSASGCGRLFPNNNGSQIFVAITSNKFGSIAAGSNALTLTAQTTGDNTNAGVVWSLTANGAPCATDCGFLSGVTPFSATYTPPAAAPASPANAPTITATAVDDSTKSDSESFTINSSGITVTITNKVNAVTAGPLGITFMASTQNDPNNQGVSWVLSLPGATCTAATCGTITLQTTGLANYQPPPSAAASPVTITATSIAPPQTASDADTFAVVNGAVSSCAGTASGMESLLNGSYAFFAQGTSVMAASFAADGNGHIQDLGGGVGGEIDINTSANPQHFTVIPTPTPPPAPPATSSSFYAVGSDNTGCLSLHTSSGATMIFRFALGKVSSGVATEGRITEFDDQFPSTSTEGTRASGPLRLQDRTAFASGDTSHLQRNYAFGVGGSGGSGDPHAVVVGAFVLDPATGVITNSDFDSDDLNAIPVVQSDVQGSTGSIGSVSTKTGRAIFTFTPKSAVWPGGITGITQTQTQAALYVVNSSELFLVTADSPNPIAAAPFFLYAGRAIATGASFNSASLSGSFILHETGALALSACNQCADVSLGLLNFASGVSSVSGTIFEYNAKNGPTTTPLLGIATYAVSSTFGRVSLTGTGLAHPPVFYIAQPTTATDKIQAFVGGTDPTAVAGSGVLEAGASTTVTTATLNGSYFFGDEDDPDDPTITNRVGVTSISAGAMTGTQFTSTSGLLSSSPINRTATIDNAKGPGTGNVGANTVAITDGSKLFFIDETSSAPASIIVVEPQ
jgi:hypothetical protein